MAADITTLLVAVLGVAGTLSSPLLSQRSADRAKRQEFELQGLQRREERLETERKSALQERQLIYAKLNTAARQYEQEMYEYLRVMAAGAPTDEGRLELARVREVFRDLYSDAQMILPDKVLESAMQVSAGLGEAYGMVKRLDNRQGFGGPGGEAEAAEAVKSARAFCHSTVYKLIIELRRMMRQDLGVAEPATSAG